MENIKGFDFQPLQIEADGSVKSGVEELARHVKNNSVTDAILICHGFRNDEADARGLYTRFLSTFADNGAAPALASRLGQRKFAVGGVFWPSMIFPEVDDSQGSALSAGDNLQYRQRLESMKAGLDAEASDTSTTCFRSWTAPPTIETRNCRSARACCASRGSCRSKT